MHHDLKCWPEPFKEAIEGRKRYEVRKFDRDFKTGDTVTLHEFDPVSGNYSGRSAGWVIGYVTKPGEWLLPEGVCVFSLMVGKPA